MKTLLNKFMTPGSQKRVAAILSVLFLGVVSVEIILQLTRVIVNGIIFIITLIAPLTGIISAETASNLPTIASQLFITYEVFVLLGSSTGGAWGIYRAVRALPGSNEYDPIPPTAVESRHG